MLTELRIATWNLERPTLNGVAKNGLRMEVMRHKQADVWVLTESSIAIQLNGYTVAATPSVTAYHRAGEHYTAILTRWPVQQVLDTWNNQVSICVEVRSPLGPAIIYGTIIAYANYRGLDGTSRRWVEHRKAVEAQGRDWLNLRRQFPGHLFVLAGDFNQSRDGSGWCEDGVSGRLLTHHLAAAGLTCLTEANLNEAFKLGRSTVDHICVGPSHRVRDWTVDAWPGTFYGRRLSDHNGVLAQVKLDPLPAGG